MSEPEFSTSEQLKKRQQMIFIGAAVIILGGGLMFIYNNAKKAQDPSARAAERVISEDFITPRGAVNPEEAWITSSEVSMEEMARRMEEQAKQLELLQNRLGRYEQDALRSDDDDADTEPEPDPNTRSARSLLPPLGTPPPAPERIEKPRRTPGAEQSGLRGIAGLRAPEPKIVRVAFAEVSSSDDELIHPHINETLPAGTFASAVMLNGLAAPTGNLGQRNPHPVLLELVDFGNLPNRFQHRIKSCRIIAAGAGELSDERAYLRLEKMTCVLRTGEVISKEAKGYITGEDGKNGLPGELVTKQGAYVARALLAGIFSGLGRAIGQSYSNINTSALGAVQTIDPSDVGQAGVAEGISNASEKVADWYLERADEVFPFVEIEAGRIVTVTFTDDIDLEANIVEKHNP